MNYNFEVFEELEKQGVHIDYMTDDYPNGSNLTFSINFFKYKRGTCWYGDNHEFGNCRQAMEASIKLALWYLEKPERIEFINSGYHNPDYIKFLDKKLDFLETLYAKDENQ
jgi:hypothetical protein